MTPRKKRPRVLPGYTLELPTHCGKIYVTVNRDGETGNPVEVFCRFGKAGGCGSAVMDGMTRVISYGLRSGLDPRDVIRALSGISCQHGGQTCLDALAKGIDTVMSM
jgi:hypothetical protein